MNSVQVEMFPAKNGDSFLISFDNGKNIIIDMGYKETYKSYIKDKLIELNNKGQEIDLLIITHIDKDHILGAIEFIKDNKYNCNPRIIKVKEVWYNSFRHIQFNKSNESKISSAEERILEDVILNCSSTISNSSSEDEEIGGYEGSTLASYLYGYGYNWNTYFGGNAVNLDDKNTYIVDDIKITLLSPNMKKLKELYYEWLDFLNSKKFNFTITNDKIFDDAYELFLLNSEEFIECNENDEVSGEIRKFDVENLLKSKPRNLDRSASNGSSIAILIEYKRKQLLFLGDAHEDIITSSLNLLREKGNNMKFDIIKVPHHGSLKNNFNWINTVQGRYYLLSTDGSIHNHPDDEVLARILNTDNHKVLCFNYPVVKVNKINNDALKDKYTYLLNIGDGKTPISINCFNGGDH